LLPSLPRRGQLADRALFLTGYRLESCLPARAVFRRCAEECIMKPLRALLLAALALAAGGVLALIFAAYQRPAMLIDWSNMLFCG
jgi:hypothetical protein